MKILAMHVLAEKKDLLDIADDYEACARDHAENLDPDDIEDRLEEIRLRVHLLRSIFAELPNTFTRRLEIEIVGEK